MLYLQPELHAVIVDVLQLVSVTVAKLTMIQQCLFKTLIILPKYYCTTLPIAF